MRPIPHNNHREKRTKFHLSSIPTKSPKYQMWKKIARQRCTACREPDEMRPPKAPRITNQYHDYVIVSEASPDLFAPLAMVHSEGSMGHVVRVYVPAGTSAKYFLRPGDKGVFREVLDGSYLPARIAMEMLKDVLDIATLEEDYADSILNDRCVDVAFPETRPGAVVFASRRLFEADTAKFAAMLSCRRTVAARVIEAFSAKNVYAKAGGAWSREGVNRTTRHLAGQYITKYPDTNTLSSVEFITASVMMREEDVVLAAKNFLARVIDFANRRGRDGPLISGVVSVRVLVAGSLVCAHPEESFEERQETEKAFLAASQTLVPRLAEVAGALHAGERWANAQKASGQERSLTSTLCRYLVAFQKWKVGDERRVASRIEHTLEVIVAERALVPPGSNDALVARLDMQTADLRGKLSKLSIRKPRPPLNKPASVTDAEDKPSEQSGDKPKRFHGGVGGLSNEQLAHELMLDKKFRITNETANEDYLVDVRVRKVLERAYTRSLVDDLTAKPPRYSRVVSMLDKFRHGLCLLANRRGVRDHVRRLLDISKISEDLENGRMGHEAQHTLLREVSGILCSLHADVAGDGAAQATRDALDVMEKALGCAHNNMLLERRVLDGQQSEGHMPGPIPRRRGSEGSMLQYWPPYGANTAKEGLHGIAVATCNYLGAIQDCINTARTDLGNRRLGKVAAVVGHRGVEYARSNFRKLLDDGEISLEGTMEWIRDAVQRLDKDPSMGICAAELLNGRPEDYLRVLHHATVDMIIFGSGDPPATYRLDVMRIKALRQHFKMDVRVFSILTSVFTMTAARSPEHTGAVTKAVSDVLVPRDSGMCRDIGLDDVRRAISSAEVDEAGVNDIMAVVTRNSDPASAVGMASVKIVCKVWLGILRDGHFPHDIKFSRAADKMRDGMVERCTKLGKMIDVSKEIYVKEYNDLILSAARLVHTN